MKKENIIQAGRLWLAGAPLFALRLVQLRSGFDPDTGLALPSSDPASLPGRILWIALLACFAAEAALCIRRPGGGKRSYACCFTAPEGPALGLLAAGSFLLAAGGALLLIRALPPQDTAAVTAAAAGALGVAGGAGFLLLAKELRSGGSPTIFPLLPAMFFSVLFVLAVYFPEESNPVLNGFYVPVLGAAMAAYFLYHLSGFTRREGSLRWFVFTGDMTVITCMAAAADGLRDAGRLLIFLGCAVSATVFLLLLRKAPLPEPETPSDEESDGIQAAEQA